MTETYRFIVCGTGGVGTAVQREALRLPWLQLVGAQVYSQAKSGVDVGELVALKPIGLQSIDDATSAGNYAIGIPLIQAVPRVCAHQPGISCPAPLGSHLTAAYGRTGRAAQLVGSERSSR